MRVLVVGSGGREHALAWKLAQEAEVLAAPGNAGIAEDVETVNIPVSDSGRLVNLARERQIDLVVVGPEDPLVAGLADQLRAANIPAFGPGADGARLEGSKAFSKDLMAEANVPTAAFVNFTDAEAAIAYAHRRFAEGRPVVVKASGLALGKGVTVCENADEAEAAIRSIMIDRVFGSAGAEVVVEDRLSGFEFSLLTIVGDHNFVSLPVAMDHKRAYDGDQGPNTGGMGAYSPVAKVPDSLVGLTEERCVAPILRTLKAKGIDYRGVLFTGLMVENGEPICLEYNVRLGDPETQTVLPRLGAGFANALWQAANGETIVAPTVLDVASTTIVVASGGYPGDYRKGLPITIGPLPDGVKVFHAGTKRDEEGRLVTNGGRVLAVNATAPTFERSRQLAYEGARAVSFEGAFYRSDIATR